MTSATPGFDDPDKLARSSVVTTVFDHLLAAVHRGDLLPGQRINDAELAKQYGVSRTPVREALQRLREIGIIEASASRFTRVADVTPAQTAQAFVVWLALFGALVDEVIPAVTSETVDQMKRDAVEFVEAIEAGDPRRMATANFSLVTCLSTESTNPALQRALTSVVHIIRLGSLHLPEYIDVGALSGAHSVLVDAARNHDVAQAHRAIDLLRGITIPQD